MPSIVSHALAANSSKKRPRLYWHLFWIAGDEITIVMSAAPAGQAGVILEYDALKNVTNISDALENMGMIATDDLNAISPDWILSRWTRDVNAS